MEIGRVRVYPTPVSRTQNRTSESPLSLLFTDLKPATFPFVKSEDPSIIILSDGIARKLQRNSAKYHKQCRIIGDLSESLSGWAPVPPRVKAKQPPTPSTDPPDKRRSEKSKIHGTRS
jgi:hypothetical protein